MFDGLRRLFWTQPNERLAKQQEVMVNLVDMFRANRPLADVWDTRKFAEEGYRRNSLIFACVSIKANAFGRPELVAKQAVADGADENLPDGHMLSKLLANCMISGYDKAGRNILRGSQTAFMRRWSMNLDVAGNAYAFIVRNSQGMPLAVRLLSRPDLVKPVPDSRGTIVEYQYGAEPNIQHMLPTDVIHEMAAPDPIEPFRGLSPIAVLARMGDLDNFAAEYLRAFFLNAGIPSGLLKFKTQQMDHGERERVRMLWKERYGMRRDTGAGGWFDVAVMDADVEYEEIGSKLRTMDLEQVFSQTESRICGAFGVHPILVAAWIGLLRSTMANYEQARRSLYNDTMLPIWTSTADQLTMDLATEFGDDIVLEYDLDDVPELQRDKTQQKELALKAWDSGLVTRNEARGEWNLDAVPTGDVFKVGAADSFEPISGETPASGIGEKEEEPVEEQEVGQEAEEEEEAALEEQSASIASLLGNGGRRLH
jgi:HK97 family phage portal protein